MPFLEIISRRRREVTDLYTTIRDAVTNAAGISINASLAAIDGSRHVLPPTYADAPHKHNMTEPDEHGIAAWVSIDSPASFANRVEEQLVRAKLGLAPLRVEVAGQFLSTMQMPHRAFDAILRDSFLDGIPFRKTDIGQAVIKASPADARALLRYDPAVLLLGGWDSTGLGGNKGQERKWPAALSVEIFGTNAMPINRAGGRLDPLGITLDAGRVIREGDAYRLVPEGEKAPPGAERPSEINHGNIAPTISPKGVLVEEIKLSGALSLSRLRRYLFGGSEDQDVAARTALALMGIYGVAAVIEDGLDLRRDCDLVADEVAWAIRGTGRSDPLEISVEDARQALEQSLADIDLSEPVLFKAGDNLEQLVARSR
jgi:CRISPR-associated protein Csb1